MKKRVLYLAVILLSFGFNSLDSEAGEPSDAVIGYFEALKNGDVEGIKHYIAGDLYEKYRVLLEENETYPEFLRDFYQGSQVHIRNSTSSGNDVIVEVEIYFPNGSTGANKLRLRKYDGDTWKIVEEIFS